MTQRIKCIDIKEATGKTVKAIVEGMYSSELLMVFTDGSLIQLYVDSEDDDADISANSLFNPDDFSATVLEEAIGDLYPDIVAERKLQVEQRESQKLADIEIGERAQYERLRQRFGGSEA